MSVKLHKLLFNSVILSCTLCMLSVNTHGKDRSFSKFTNTAIQPVFLGSNPDFYFHAPSSIKDFASTFNVLLKKCGFINPQAFVPSQESVYKNADLVWSDQDINVAGLLFDRVNENDSAEIIHNLTSSRREQCDGWFGKKPGQNIVYNAISVDTTYFACVTGNNSSFDSVLLFKTPDYDSVIWQWSEASEENLRKTTELIKIRITAMLGR